MYFLLFFYQTCEGVCLNLYIYLFFLIFFDHVNIIKLAVTSVVVLYRVPIIPFTTPKKKFEGSRKNIVGRI